MARASLIGIPPEQQFDAMMRNALDLSNGRGKNRNIYDRLGMIGRCLYNLLLLELIEPSHAYNLIADLGFSKLRGTSKRNFQKVIQKARDDIVPGTDFPDFPYMPVFWMIPSSTNSIAALKVKNEVLKEEIRAKVAQEQLDDIQDVEEIDGKTGKNDKNDKNVITRIDPLGAMHKLGIQLERVLRVNTTTSELKEYLMTVKIYHDILISLMKYDGEEYENVDLLALMKKFDATGDFILELDEETPERGIAGKYQRLLVKLDKN